MSPSHGPAGVKDPGPGADGAPVTTDTAAATEARIGRLTVHAGLRVLAVLETAAGRVGLLASDLRAMHLLQAAGPQSAGALADRMAVPRSVVTLVADRLQGKGLLTRERDRGDGRKVVLALSADGRRVLDEAAVHVSADLRAFLAPLSPAQVDDLAALLSEVVDLR